MPTSILLSLWWDVRAGGGGWWSYPVVGGVWVEPGGGDGDDGVLPFLDSSIVKHIINDSQVPLTLRRDAIGAGGGVELSCVWVWVETGGGDGDGFWGLAKGTRVLYTWV